MTAFNWTCPYCRHPQVVTDTNITTDTGRFGIGDNAISKALGYSTTAVACQNKDCRKVYLSFTVTQDTDYSNGRWYGGKDLERWQLWPESSAKPQPDYIPK